MILYNVNTMPIKYTIYKISNVNDETQFYIGSTKSFSSRKSHHKKNTTNKRGKRYWTKLYVYIRNSGGCDNFKIDIIEEQEYESKQEALTKEQEYINNLKPPLNSINAIKHI